MVRIFFSLCLPALLALVTATAHATAPLEAASIVTACKAERLSLSDRDNGGKPVSDKPAIPSGPDTCKSFLIDYFKATMAPQVAGEPKACVRLPDFVAFRALADVLIEGAGDRDLKGVSAKQLADQAFSARYPCQSR